MSLRYVMSELSSNWHRSGWWKGRVEQRINAPIQSVVKPKSSASNVLNKEWSTLVVLDACRMDLFREAECRIEFDEVQAKTSVGSATPEWLKQTFDDSHGDIVYVSGNPMVSRHRPNAFHDLVEVWREAYDPETAVIDPSQVTEAAINVHERYPEKRVIVHYMQPHYPFLQRPDLNYADYKFEDVGMERKNPEADDFANVWSALEAGVVDIGNVWEGYKQNLEKVLSEVVELTDTIDERVVVTSDHGNAMGERSWPVPLRTFGHPENQRLFRLVRVPWAVLDGPERTVVEGDTSTSEATYGDEVEDRLENLGYVQ